MHPLIHSFIALEFNSQLRCDQAKVKVEITFVMFLVVTTKTTALLHHQITDNKILNQQQNTKSFQLIFQKLQDKLFLRNTLSLLYCHNLNNQHVDKIFIIHSIFFLFFFCFDVLIVIIHV